MNCPSDPSLGIGALAIDEEGCQVRITAIHPGDYVARVLVCRCGTCVTVAGGQGYNRYLPEQLVPYEIVIDELPI